MKVIQKLLGHKTAGLTLDRYGHLFPTISMRLQWPLTPPAATAADDSNAQTCCSGRNSL